MRNATLTIINRPSETYDRARVLHRWDTTDTVVTLTGGGLGKVEGRLGKPALRRRIERHGLLRRSKTLAIG